MDNTIKFTIGSFFQGEGFQRARDSVGTLNRTVKAGRESITQVASAFGALDAKAAQAMSAVTGLVNGFLSLNPVIFGITAAISALAWGISKCREEQEKAEQAVKKHREEMEKLATKVNQSIYDKAIADAKKLGDEYERITKHANDMTAAMNALNNTRAGSGSILQLQADKITAVFNEITEDGKKLVAAEYDLKIAVTNAQIEREKSNQQVAAAHQAIVDADNKVANLQQQRAEMELQLSRLKQNNLAFETATAEERTKWLNNQRELQAKIAEVGQRIANVESEKEVLLVKEQAAIAARENVETLVTMKITEAEQKQIEENRSIEERAAAEAAAAKAAEEKAAKDAELAAEENALKIQEESFKAARERQEKEIKEAADLQRELNDSAKSLKAAQDAYSEAIKKYHESGAGLRNGQQSYGDYVKQGGDIAVADALKEGVRAVQDLQRAARFGERASRDRANAEKRAARDADTANKIAAKNQKLLTKWDKDFMDKYNKAQEADNRDQSEFDAATLAMQNAEQHLADIKDKLGLLGLK